MIPRWGIFALALSLTPLPVAAQARGDETQIRLLQAEQAGAWNAHDSARYAALFTGDAHVVNVLGWHWRSRAELRTKLAAAFASVFARSRMTIVGTDVQWIKPDVAVAHVTWTMTGAASPTGAGSDAPEQGIQTQVLVKRAGTWRISEFQNTNSVPERPFPASQR